MTNDPIAPTQTTGPQGGEAFSTPPAAHSPKYADYDHTVIDLTVTHPKWGDLPFTAAANDSEPMGQSLYMRALAGEFGTIAPYDGPPPPDPQEVLAQEVRGERNRRLAALDAVVTNPLRWAEFSEPQKVALTAYRQALLDVPQQAGFPDTVAWPEQPGFLNPQASDSQGGSTGPGGAPPMPPFLPPIL